MHFRTRSSTPRFLRPQLIRFFTPWSIYQQWNTMFICYILESIRISRVVGRPLHQQNLFTHPDPSLSYPAHVCHYNTASHDTSDVTVTRDDVSEALDGAVTGCQSRAQTTTSFHRQLGLSPTRLQEISHGHLLLPLTSGQAAAS